MYFSCRFWLHAACGRKNLPARRSGAQHRKMGDPRIKRYTILSSKRKNFSAHDGYLSGSLPWFKLTLTGDKGKNLRSPLPVLLMRFLDTLTERLSAVKDEKRNRFILVLSTAFLLTFLIIPSHQFIPS